MVRGHHVYKISVAGRGTLPEDLEGTPSGGIQSPVDNFAVTVIKGLPDIQ